MGTAESFNGKLRDEPLLDREIFYSLRGRAAQRIDQVLIEARQHYSMDRPHLALATGPPAPGGRRGLAGMPLHPSAGQDARVVYH